MICRPAAVRALASRANGVVVTRRALIQAATPAFSTLAGRTSLTASVPVSAQPPAFRFLSTAAAAEPAAAPAAASTKQPFVPTPERKYEHFVNVEVTDKGVGIVRFDCANQSVNTISFAVKDEAKKMWAEEIQNNPNVKSVVFTSAKKAGFIAGADIKDIKKLEDKQQLLGIIEDGIDFFKNTLRAKNIPLVCAIDGPALGGGLEWAMWCDYRICTDSPKTKMGLPEVKLGLLPGFGGTQNLPKLVGVQAALDMMLTGKDIRPDKAKKMGLVDLVVAPQSLEKVAIQCAEELANGTLKPKRKSKSTMNKLLEDNQYGRKIIWNQVEKMVNKQTNGNYPAPFAIMQCVEHGLMNPGEEGLRNEREQFAKLAATNESSALINIFEGMTAMKKHSYGDAGHPVKNVAVIGAGLMGAGISQVSAEKGKYTVMLKDKDDAGVGRGMAMITDSWKGKLKKKRMTQYAVNKNTSNVIPLTDDNPIWEKHFSQADVVIEAVFENLDLKKKIVADMERVTPDHCVFATNTSAIPITKIAEGAKRPENIIGMHYFSPVPMMPLLEIIPHAGTSAAATATAFEVGTKQGKTCIVVKDVPGFYVNRCLGPFLVEVSALARDGASLEMLDKSMTKFGMPVGPVTLADEVGVDIASHVASFLSEADLGVRMTGGDISLLQEMVNKKWLGKKTGQGFYTYPKGKGKKKFINDEVKAYAKQFVKEDLKLSEKDIQDRLVSR